MGICNGFALLLRQSLLKSSKKFPFKVMDPKVVLQDTTMLLVDLTQLLYVGKHVGGARETKTYPDAESFLQSLDPIGEIEVKKNRSIENTLNVFSHDSAADKITQKILNIQNKWSEQCMYNKVQSNLKSIYLVLDGDSPVAKNETRKTRNANKDANYVMRTLENAGIDVSNYQSRIKQRCYLTETVDGQYMRGSLRRYLVQRDNRSTMIHHTIINLRKIQFMGAVDLYLVNGIERESPNGCITQVWRATREQNHTHEHICQNIPYYEADSIIPYIWANVKSPNDKACILSSDSDMLLTLLSVGDPNFYLWSYVTLDGIESRGACRGKVIISCNVDGMSPKTHLNLLTHLTMGGCDYVESLPQCGAVRLLKGCEQITSSFDNQDLFSNLRFATHCDVYPDAVYQENNDAIFRVNHSFVIEGNDIWNKIRDIVLKREDTFPIRLKDYVYLVVLKQSNSGKILEAYNRMGRIKCFPLLSDGVCTKFEWSMRRRLFFLSLVSESRMGLERKMMCDEGAAMKCGFSYGDFLYVNKFE